MTQLSRRQFLSRTGAFGATASLATLASSSVLRAAAANTSGYKALVCIYLNGGMDHSDSIIPYDQTSWTTLSNTRTSLFSAYNASQSSSSRNRANLLKLNPTNASSLGGREFSMPPQLAPLHNAFEAGDLAIVGNVGPLEQPTTRAQVDAGTAKLPPRLGSHNDMASMWTSLGVEGTRLGWGGQFADAAMASAPSDDPTFAAVTTGLNNPFLAGNTVRPFRVSSDNGLVPEVVSKTFLLGGNTTDMTIRGQLKDYLAAPGFNEQNYYAADYTAARSRSIENSQRMLDARAAASGFATAFPNEPLGRQLKLIAETINIQSALNISRQVFFVNVGGFDTHSGQTSTLPALQSTLANALGALRSALQEVGQWANTTVFTASDFGRAMIDNGDGTDHGWGGHHMVMGGAVNGQRIYGQLPSANTQTGSYMPGRGAMIPAVSVEQYAATLGSWFGLTNSELATIFPNLSRFNQANLGFV